MKKILRTLRSVFLVDPGRFLLQYFLTAVSGVAAARIAAATESVFGEARAFATGERTVLPLLGAIGILLLLGAISEAAEGGSIYISQSYDTIAREKLMRQMNDHVGRLPCLAFESPETLNKINGAYAGVGSVRGFVHSVMAVCTYYVPYFVVYGAYLYTLRPVLVAAIPIVLIPAVISEILKAKLYADLEEQSSPLRRKEECCASYVGESGFAKETRLLGAVGFFLEKFRKTRRQLDRLEQKARRRGFLLESAGTALHFLGFFAVIFLLVDSIFKGYIRPGAFAAVFATIGTVMEQCDMLVGEQLASLSEGYGSMCQYFALEDLEEEPEENTGCEDAPGFRLENVSFAYPGGEPVLKEINLTIRPGETLALVGENGSGKTTLTKLLLGIYPATSGKLHRDGASRKDCSGIFQAFGKYPMTVRENLRLSDPSITDRHLEEALEQAGLELPLDTMLSRPFGGTELSGGQWQRIAIARGLVKNSKFLVMDEPTAAIDPAREHFLYRVFLDAAKGKTAVIVTHRLGLARQCHRIAFLEDGRLTAVGTHDELLQSCPPYAAQWNAQAGAYKERDR